MIKEIKSLDEIFDEQEIDNIYNEWFDELDLPHIPKHDTEELLEGIE